MSIKGNSVGGLLPTPEQIGALSGTDTTLSVTNKAADAAAVGKMLEGKAPASHTTDKNNPHGVTAEHVGARPNTWLPTPAEIGASPMEYAKKVGNPHNLLDNSDFRNPVSEDGNTIVRWNADAGLTAVLSGSGVELTGNKVDWWLGFTHSIETSKLQKGKKYTFAAHGYFSNSGRLLCWGSDTYGVVYFGADSGCKTIACQIMFPDNMLDETVIISISPDTDGVGNTAIVEWAALYEGEYTAETLPEYQPKGYAAELLACNVADTGNVLGMKLSWENASPTSTFAEQSIWKDFRKYSAIVVVAVLSTEFNNQYVTAIFPKGENMEISHLSNTDFRKTRRLMHFTDEKIYISSGYVEADTVDNGAIIPYRIYVF